MKNQEAMVQALEGIPLYFDEQMKYHTSFKIGGCADVLANPRGEEDLVKLLGYAKQHDIPVTVMGNGSDLLVSDKGIRGMVIKIASGFESARLEGGQILFGGGIKLSAAASFAYKNGLTGMEFAHGIPGSLGGAVYMNAGAYGGEMAHIVKKTWYVNEDGTMGICQGDDHAFAYRHSFFTNQKAIITKVLVKLEKGNLNEIKDKMDALSASRKEKQPIEFPSAGSTFKRPEGYFAGKLIEDAGLKGKRIGGAMVSQKHCGFVINTGDATCEDVQRLILYIQNEVQQKFGVTLECEVKFVGEK